MSVRKDFIQVNVRVSESMRDKCRDAATKAELSLVEWIRAAMQEKLEDKCNILKKEKLELEKVIAEMEKSQSNINTTPLTDDELEKRIEKLLDEKFTHIDNTYVETEELANHWDQICVICHTFVEVGVKTCPKCGADLTKYSTLIPKQKTVDAFLHQKD